MNKNIDLTKILDGCPKGTKLYSPLFGEVEFKEIPTISNPQIIVDIIDDCGTSCPVTFTPNGRYFPGYNAECLLFPSSTLRDWSKFERFWDKPKMKMKRFSPKTLQPFDRVLVRVNDDSEWNCDLFSHHKRGDTYPYICIGGIWKQCVPYNEETKHLAGTTDDCPEYYKWWEE